MTNPISRRSALTAGAIAASAPALVPAFSPAHAASGSPFGMGVASGDPDAKGFVIWTRLATDPTAADGFGGMGSARTDVAWAVAEDDAFSRVVASGTVTTGPDVGHSVHVELDTLRPSTQYYYRFTAAGATSPTGRARTAPADGLTTPCRIAVASCAQWEHGWFTAYRDIANSNPDLVVHLGDYIYEHGPLGYPVGVRARSMVGGETKTLADYRRRYGLYRSDADLQAAHAAAPWVTVFDDHEVDNDWAGMHHEVFGKTEAFAKRRAAAFTAYYENMPLRASQRPTDAGMQLYRRLRWGSLINLHMLDTRQYRDVQVCGWVGPCDAAKDPKRTMLGQQQENWLARGYATTARWDILGNQVMFAPFDTTEGWWNTTNPDAWDGYIPARDRVMADWARANVRNPVVLTGDYHTAFAFNLLRGKEAAGVEFVTTSITSGGDGSPDISRTSVDNPHLRFKQDARGYVLMDVTAERIRAQFRAVSQVKKRGGTVSTAATFDVADGSRTVTPA